MKVLITVIAIMIFAIPSRAQVADSSRFVPSYVYTDSTEIKKMVEQHKDNKDMAKSVGIIAGVILSAALILRLLPN